MGRGIIPINVIDKTDSWFAGSVSILDNHVPDFLDGETAVGCPAFRQQVVQGIIADANGPRYDIPLLCARIDYDV